MADHDKWDVVLVGGGGGGFVLALLLAQKGFRIAVLEQSPHSRGRQRGEIIQPNGLKILDELKLLPALTQSDVYRWHQVHFLSGGGEPLCAIDYQRLASPYNYALVVLPEVIQNIFVNEVDRHANIKVFWGEQLDTLLWKEGKVVGAVASRSDRPEEQRTLHASMVVGGDGIFSKTREAMGIPFSIHPYAKGYFAMILDRPTGFQEEVRFFMGKGIFFAAMPVSRKKMFILYQIPVSEAERIKSAGITALKRAIFSINPSVAAFMEGPLRGFSLWEQAAFIPCYRVRCSRWVVDGAALIGDAAHAMNPHVAQGRNAVMADAVALAHVLEESLLRQDCSQKALSDYEQVRRPDIDALQRLSDELTWLWESRFPPWIWARERSFKVIHKDPALRDKILTTIAGIKVQPFSLLDRWRALHLFGPV